MGAIPIGLSARSYIEFYPVIYQCYVNNDGIQGWQNASYSYHYIRYNIDYGSLTQFVSFNWKFIDAVNGNNTIGRVFVTNNNIMGDMINSWQDTVENATFLLSTDFANLVGSVAISTTTPYRYVVITLNVGDLGTSTSLYTGSGASGFYLIKNNSRISIKYRL